MLKYHTIDVSCKAIPGEVSLIFNITGCTIKCPGCNEKTLWKDKGTPLTFDEVRAILKNYNSAVTCVCFMGGEHEPSEINSLARLTKHLYPCLHTAWYSGLNRIPDEIEYHNFNYLKTGRYEASKGVLGEQGTNQRVFMVSEDCTLTDITHKYIRTEPDEVRKPEDEVNNAIEAGEEAIQEEIPEETATSAIDEIEELAYEEDVNTKDENSSEIAEEEPPIEDNNDTKPENPSQPDGIIMEI